jgi:hypothetical protein
MISDKEKLDLIQKNYSDLVLKYNILDKNYKELCKEALEQPAQEPVAWKDEEGIWEFEWESYSENKKPLYTHPHQVVPTSTWQGLTDDEINSFYGKSTYEGLNGFARAIEQALKEKNT